MAIASIETKSRAQLRSMFGEKAKFNKDHDFLFSPELSAIFLKDFIDSQEYLPESVRLYLNSLAQKFPDFINRAKEMSLEKEASETLWNKFGSPRFALAVPVFNTLTENVVEASNYLQQETEVGLDYVKKLLDNIKYAVLMFYESEINATETLREESEEAVVEINNVSTAGNEIIEARAVESDKYFSSEVSEREDQVKSLKQSQKNWTEFMRNLLNKKGEIDVFSKRGMVLELDPTQAL